MASILVRHVFPLCQNHEKASTQWLRISLNRNVSNGPLAHPLAGSLAPLTRSLAPHCLLRSRASLRLLVRSFTHSLAPELVGQQNIFVQFWRCFESLCSIRFVSRALMARLAFYDGKHLSERKYAWIKSLAAQRGKLDWQHHLYGVIQKEKNRHNDTTRVRDWRSQSLRWRYTWKSIHADDDTRNRRYTHAPE